MIVLALVAVQAWSIFFAVICFNALSGIATEPTLMIDKLNLMSKGPVIVIRAGEEETIDPEIVLGDLISLSAGDHRVMPSFKRELLE